jgi:hypothetical protein
VNSAHDTTHALLTTYIPTFPPPSNHRFGIRSSLDIKGYSYVIRCLYDTLPQEWRTKEFFQVGGAGYLNISSIAPSRTQFGLGSYV